MVANVNKAFTSLEQSKQLMKLGIGISAADMHYWETDVETFGKQSKQLNTPDIGFDSNFYYGTDNGKIYHYIPAWSLDALLTIIAKQNFTIKSSYIDEREYNIDIPCRHCKIWFPSLLDAAFEMIVWLKENKKL